MRGFSFQQYWLYAIMEMGKRIDNRTWKPPKNIIGKRIALHASKKIDVESARLIRSISGETIYTAVPVPTGVIVATAVVDGHCTESSNKWFFGPYGWILSGVVKLDEPIRCKGMLKLWTVPEDIQWEIFYQLVRDRHYVANEVEYD